MPNVLLVVRRKVLAQSLIRSLRSYGQFSFYEEYNYAHSALTAEACSADIVVIEIPENDREQPACCLEMAVNTKKLLPACKIMLICPENDSDAQQLVVEAKRAQIIDAFVFYDASLDYMIAALEGLS